jgi:hypothetical protein
MKTLLSLLVLGLLLGAQARAEEQLMKDAGSAALAKALGGHALVCGPSDEKAAKNEEAGFFPLTITATDKGAGKTLLSVKSKDPEVGFGYGGSEFDPTDNGGDWYVISCGDDGRRHLFLELNEYVLDKTYRCQGDGDEVHGDLSGIVAEIWDAGTISAAGVQCCVK